jgi:ParB-like chromosome segregation protein Spo0J
LAAKQLKLKEVPTIVLDHLSEREAKALVLADNKLAMNSGWDFEKLSNEISTLAELDFDISVIGFDEQELDALLKDAADILPSGSLEPESVVNVASHTRTYTKSEVDIDNLENIMILKIKLSEKNFFKVKSALEKIDENISEAIVKLIDQQ